MKCTGGLQRVAIVAAMIAAFALPAAAQTSADTAAIRAAALDYIDGWYTADGARMRPSPISSGFAMRPPS